jgi:hypothetical protein
MPNRRNTFQSAWGKAIFTAKIGDVFVTSHRSWPKFKKIARSCGFFFSDSIDIHNGHKVHTLTRIK